MKKISLSLGFMLLAYVGLAQETAQSSDRWTLEECIDYAAEHNLQVKQSQLNLLSSKVELNRSRADLFPSLNAGTSYSNSVGRSIDPFTNVIIDEPVTSQNYSLSGGVTLFNGFSRINTIRQSKLNFQANEFELASTKNDIALQIVTAYTNILFNRELLANAESRLQTTELQRERTRRQVEVGALAQASLYEIEAQYASDELAVTNAYNNLALARLNLKQLLQLPADVDLDIVVPELEIENAVEYPVSAQEVYETAEETQPSIAAADTWVESSQMGLRVARGNLYPSITAQGGISTAYSSAAPDELPKEGTGFTQEEVEIGYFNHPTDGRTTVYSVTQRPAETEDFTYPDQLDYNLRRFVQVSLNIPIFNGLSTRSAVARARIQEDQSRLQAQIARQQLRQTIEQAAQDVKAAALTYRSNENQVRSLREAFRSAEQRFNLGATNAVDYNIAKTNLDVAESNLIRAKYDYIFKTKILDFYLNKPLSFN